MRIRGYQEPKSSFLSMEKDAAIIINRILSNERLKRLLYFTSSDALEQRNLTAEESISLLGKNIKLVPKLYVDNEVLNYIFITFDHFSIGENPEFRDNKIHIDILCHYDQWQLKDFALRPYKIAGEIDLMLKDTRLTGIGKLEFEEAVNINTNDEFAGVCLTYKAYHGAEDEKRMPNPMDEERFEEDFAAMFD